MKNQLFRKQIPCQIVFDLLEKICLVKTETYYLINHNAYKKLLFYKYEQPFLDEIIHYYYFSKQFYVTRPLSYKSFINLIRQICNNSNIQYTSLIKYSASDYDIQYTIYRTAAMSDTFMSDTFMQSIENDNDTPSLTTMSSQPTEKTDAPS
jgi:hypothetical protein